MKQAALIAFIISLSHFAYSFEMGCSIPPDQLNEYGTHITKIVSETSRSLPDNIPVQSDFEFSIVNGKKNFTGTFEAFFRPSEDNFISVIPVPILGFDVSRDRVVIYICAHMTDNPADTHLTVYFMRGYHIDPTNKSNFFGDLANKPSLKVKAVPASLLGISEFRKFFLSIFRYIPFVDIYFETFSLVQRVLANALGDITGLGVERIELTTEFLRVSSVVNLDSPREARMNRTFKLVKPDLGPGADIESKSSFKGKIDDDVLRLLDSSNVNFEEIQDPQLK